MPSPINQFPTGLLSALGAKVGGHNPLNFGDDVSGTFDLRELYLLSLREQITMAAIAAVNAATGSFAAPGIVPQGEVWYVWHYSVVTSLLAAANIVLAPSANFVVNNIAVGPAVSQGGAAATAPEAIAQGPFWLQGGMGLTFRCISLTGAANVAGNALITRLRV
jgi:hypothetical protein